MAKLLEVVFVEQRCEADLEMAALGPCVDSVRDTRNPDAQLVGHLFEERLPLKRFTTESTEAPDEYATDFSRPRGVKKSIETISVGHRPGYGFIEEFVALGNR